ncbi:MAG: 2'-5' RNA ligase family protein [Sciscionella sp.]|nr:2'-5' RNA ligase family protein [Sciscionella sp.]
MARLFSALIPPEDALDELSATVDAVTSPAGVGIRRFAREQWHITLAFYGEDDPGRRAGWLRPRVAGRHAPRLRLAGGGSFPGVCWAGVSVDGYAGTLTELAKAAGADRRFYPHLTVARYRIRPPRTPAATVRPLRAALSAHSGRWFTPTDVVLVRSDPSSTGHRYTVVERIPLRACS